MMNFGWPESNGGPKHRVGFEGALISDIKRLSDGYSRQSDASIDTRNHTSDIRDRILDNTVEQNIFTTQKIAIAAAAETAENEELVVS